MSFQIRKATPKDAEQILKIAEMWPTNFTLEGIDEMRRSLETNPAMVATSEDAILGFFVSQERPLESELLWLVVDPNHTRKGIGKALVMKYLESVSVNKPCFLRTATLDSTIPSTQFSGKGFASTHSFFRSLGFTDSEVLPGYWGPTSHCLTMVLRRQSK